MAPDGRDESDGPDEASGSPVDEPQPDVDELLARLHDQLAATADRPVETEASRWLGEAEAVTADVASGHAPRAAVEKRTLQVRELLSHVERTGDDEANEHLAAARRLVDALEDRL